MSIEADFLTCCAAKLEELCGRIEVCLGKLTADQIWMRGSENQNAVGNLVLHLNGNVRQWILSGVGGERDARDRDAEFAARGGKDPQELANLLRDTVNRAVATIRELPPARLAERKTIQNYEGTVLKAILHVVEHFSGHTMQIIFITKMLTGEDMGFYAHLSKRQSVPKSVA